MLIYRLKRDNRHDVVEFLVDELKESLLNKNISFENTIFTNVPRRRVSVRKYGFDHAEVLARALAKDLGTEYKKLLVSKAKRDQKKSQGKDERIKNAEFDYKRNAPDITGKSVIIVDDIITTGASISACATLLKGLGAKRIAALALSIAYSDEYVPFKREEYKK
jgi:ComF family protein